VRWSGAVLAGGASRRMGRDKSAIEIDGTTMVQRVLDALAAAGADETFVVGPTGVPDETPGAGPLGGLVTALRHARHDHVVVLACDLVSPSAALVRRVVEEGQHAVAAVPRVDGRPQWLHGMWSRAGCLAALEAAFAAGERSLHGAAQHVDVTLFDDASPSYRDADSPGDLGGPG